MEIKSSICWTGVYRNTLRNMKRMKKISVVVVISLIVFNKVDAQQTNSYNLQQCIDAAIQHNVKSAEELNEVSINGAKVADLINDKLAAIGEKIAVSKFERIDAPYVSNYIHGANRMGVLVGFTHDAGDAGKDVAMQIAAMNPLAVDENSIPEDVVAREKAIAIDVVKAEGKPAEMAEKIAMGKLNKFFKDNTLMAQAFVKDNNKSVADFLKSVNADLKVIEFRRVALG